MSRVLSGFGRFFRSLYARITLVYLVSLLLLSVATAWIAVSQFNQLSREMEQRMQINLAHNLADVMATPLLHGPESPAVRQAVQRIRSINPSLRLYVLNANGRVIGNYTGTQCPANARVNVAPLNDLLGPHPMLPIFATGPCSTAANVFSVARIHYGKIQRPGYLFVVLHAGSRMSMFSMLRTSSITRTLIVAGFVALLVSIIAGLLLFALLTRRFSALTDAVQRFAGGDYSQRIKPGRDDEIGVLGRAFNDMAGTIEAQLNALRVNDRQRRELVANLSHDFRTPLTSLRGYAEQLRDGYDLSVETRQAHLDAIFANTQRLTRLAQQLSTLARVDAYEQPLCTDVFSLSELVYDIAGKFSPQARTADVTLNVHCTPMAISVAADIALIDRLLTNLVDNALYATPAGGSLGLAVTTHAGKAVVRVTDTGTGMNAEEVPLVTQRFYRTAASRGKREGSGLGLAIAAEICERHGTRLTICTAPGQGTEIGFELPLARELQ
ncbi:MAG: HAMP domain-containing histidine kinase [Sinobacteraceae bacterium]|nr:HAMP domain-containing histidine kinase [Nevskiaceae bacterium]